MSTAVCEAPDRYPQKPGFALPALSTDCHTHIFNPDGASGLDANRSYSPSVATETQFNELHKALGIERSVIVQPSVYGIDNRTTLDVVARSPESLRAVVVVEQNVKPATLVAMHDQGARGARINMLFGSSAVYDNLSTVARTLGSIDRGWHLQLLTDVSELDDLYGLVSALEVDVVFDHFGHMPVHRGVNNPGFQALLRLLDEGRCWVKLSGAYRVTGASQIPYTDVDCLAQELLSHNPERLVWGSDWPHPQFDGVMPNDGALLDELARWVPDSATREKILVSNPARLYGFDQ
ncbi:MAG: amidohydrolase family protein [Granulosicoccus sp.]|nr:amidohydrolase family protein [Granulosicoccus sp.]